METMELTIEQRQIISAALQSYTNELTIASYEQHPEDQANLNQFIIKVMDLKSLIE